MMRQSLAAVALIRRQTAGRVLWLARWNTKWGAYNWVSGHKRPDETFRQCVIREVGEELGLRDGEDFAVAEHPAAHVEFSARSKRAGVQTAYTMELFDVELCGESAAGRVDVDPQTRWLTELEIRSKVCEDGRPVSETMGQLLAEVVPPAS